MIAHINKIKFPHEIIGQNLHCINSAYSSSTTKVILSMATHRTYWFLVCTHLRTYFWKVTISQKYIISTSLLSILWNIISMQNANLNANLCSFEAQKERKITLCTFFSHAGYHKFEMDKKKLCNIFWLLYNKLGAI